MNLSIIISLFFFFSKSLGQYRPDWDSLDSRPLPEWYDKAKIGIFLHWGVYSVPSFGSEWFWWRWQGEHEERHVKFMEENYPPNFTYQDFAPEFRAEFFDPKFWAQLFKQSGAKYVVLTSKHHEGYALWPSQYSYSWNSMDVGPKMDLVDKLLTELRNTELHVGLYHSLFEWFHPLYNEDKANNFTTSVFVDSKIIPEMKELIEKYQPEILWSDGDGEALDTYWKSKEFLTWLYNESPVKEVVVTNDRWGSNIGCQHGGFFTCADRYNPGHLLPRKWENCLTVDRESWGYRRNATFSDILTIHELITTITETVSCGGNVLINVGPTKEGTIIPIFQERLLQLGEWLQINGDSIYESVPWTTQNDTLTSGVWYTAKNSTVYAIVLNWPEDNILQVASALPLFGNGETEVTLLGNEGKLLWEISNDKVSITFPNRSIVNSQWAWTLKITATTK